MDPSWMRKHLPHCTVTPASASPFCLQTVPHLPSVPTPPFLQPHTPHLAGDQPLPFFLGLKIERENVVPGEGVRGDESQVQHPLDLQLPQLLGQTAAIEDLPTLHSCLGAYAPVQACSHPTARPPTRIPYQRRQWPCRSHVRPCREHARKPHGCATASYRAATSRVRFSERNLWKSRPSSAATVSSSRPRNHDEGEVPGGTEMRGRYEGSPGGHPLPQQQLQGRKCGTAIRDGR